MWQGVTFKETLKKASDGTRRKGRFSVGLKARGCEWEQWTVPCGCSRTKQGEEAAGEAVGDTGDGSGPGRAGQDVGVCLRRGRFQNSFGTLARCRHRRGLELLGEQGHKVLREALLGMGRSTGSGHSGRSKAGEARRGPRVLQLGSGKEAQGRIIVLLLNM